MTILDLSGDWELVEATGGQGCPIAIPGDTISALVAAGVIDDPYRGCNELECQWIGRRDWRIGRTFDVPEEVVRRRQLLLYAESVDTFAEVSVNGERVATCGNMFYPLRASIEGLLRAGENRIDILFDAPERRAAERASTLAYPVPHIDYPIQSPHRNLVRKVQCHAGWDWGPCLMPSGIYGDIRIVATDGLRIDYLSATTRREGADWLLETTIEFCSMIEGGQELLVRLSRMEHPVGRQRGGRCGGMPPAGGVAEDAEGRRWLGRRSPRQNHADLYPRSGAAAGARGGHPPPDSEHASLAPTGELAWRVPVRLKIGEQRLIDRRVIHDPKIWWPAGYGEQPLYRLTVDMAGARAETTVGFREIEVVSTEDGQGRSLLLRVNGRDLFCKGANWIPTDALPARQTRERCERLLRDAVSAHMNMIRVWGGGNYERDWFYDTCDRLGLLVWQDFMFSCALYPADPPFLDDVRREAEHQIRRLRGHPSLALWCGNNENIGALDWFEVSRANRDRYLIDYDRLNEGVLGDAVRRLDPGRIFWPSSPSGGAGDYSDNWHDDSRGDMHYWSVWHEGKSFDAYYDVTPRFCSEFGFQSFPSLDCLKAYIPEDQRNLTSPTMEHHQRHPSGNAIIIESLARYFRFPEGLANLMYLSQVQQALAIETAVEYWRSTRPTCMGALYWQLNDLWPAVSWSSIEYDGRWKMLHWAARRFFDPLLICAFSKRESSSEAWLCSDGDTPITGRVVARFIDFDGETIWSREAPVRCDPDSSAPLLVVNHAELGADPTTGFLHLWFEGSPQGGASIVREHWSFLTHPKRCAPRNAGLQVDAAPESQDCCLLTLRTARPAFWVCLDAEGLAGRFDDNLLLILPNRDYRLRFRGMDEAGHPTEVSTADLLSSLHIYDLRSSYR